MRVIHGIWAQDALCLWAENPGPRALPGPGPGGPGPGGMDSPAHPFACAAAELADLLAALPDPAGEAAGKAARHELTLLLPSAGRPAVPLASAIGAPAGRARVSLSRWRVPVLAFEPAAAHDVLAALRDPGRARRGGGRLACPTWPRWRPSPPTWWPAAGCCPCWPPARDTPPGGGRCSAAPTRNGPATWPRPCPRPAGPP